MISVRVQPAAQNLPIYSGAARFSMLFTFQNQGCGAFSKDKPIPVFIKGTAGSLRCIIAGGERSHTIEGGKNNRGDGRLGSSGDDDIGFPSLDHMISIQDRIIATDRQST